MHCVLFINRNYVHRYKVISIACLLSLQASKAKSLSITNTVNMDNNYVATAGLFHNTAYDVNFKHPELAVVDGTLDADSYIIK